MALLLGVTVRSIAAGPRIHKEWDDEIRTAVAGYEAGEVVPALDNLVSEILALRRPDEPIGDALLRGDVSAPFREAVEAAIESRGPQEAQRACIRRSYLLGYSLLCAQLAWPFAIVDRVVDDHPVSRFVTLGGRVVFTSSIVLTLLFAVALLRASNSLSSKVTAGKNAGTPTHVV
ncbi:MAG: hypothetical protein ACREP9_07605 [Candidatus Dormibacteraceae bacterium]